MDYCKHVPYQFFHTANLTILFITGLFGLFPLPFGAIFSLSSGVLVNLAFALAKKTVSPQVKATCIWLLFSVGSALTLPYVILISGKVNQSGGSHHLLMLIPATAAAAVLYAVFSSIQTICGVLIYMVVATYYLKEND